MPIARPSWRGALFSVPLACLALHSARGEDNPTARALEFGDACRRSDQAEVEQTFKNGAIDVNAGNAKTGDTALHWAVRGPASKGAARRAIVALLLEHGANPNALNRELETPLYCAIAAKADEALLTLLLDHGADINAEALSRWHPSPRHRGAPIHQAAAALDVPILKFLLAHKANVSTTYNLNADSALMAIFGSSVEGDIRDQDFTSEKSRGAAAQIMTLLLDAGADVQYRNKLGQTALHWAARGNHLQCIRELLSRGADPTALSEDGRCALHFAAANAKYHDRRVFEALLSNKKLSINQRDEKGDTPLHVAVRAQNGDAIESLLLLGAETGIPNKQHQIPLDLPEASALKESIRDMLERYTTRPETEPPLGTPPIQIVPRRPRPQARNGSDAASALRS